jgi:hypothetical protein
LLREDIALKRFGFLIALGLGLGACSSLPTAVGPLPVGGVWQITYDLEPRYASQIDSYLSKRVRLTLNTSDKSDPAEVRAYQADGAGTRIGSAFRSSNGNLTLLLADCSPAATNGVCNQITFSSVTPEQMSGTMAYSDNGKNLNLENVKVSAKLVEAEK